MTEPGSTESAILASWSANADRWTRAVREGAIPSRRAGTDRAMVNAILARAPRLVLDAGCGEGWLVRALASRGVKAAGFDAEPALVDAAQAAYPSADFWVGRLTDPAPPEALSADRYDVIALNFALLGEAPEVALSALAKLLAPRGAILIQTLHPDNFTHAANGWQTESFQTLPDTWQPMPWYAHSVDSWTQAAERAGLAVVGLTAPPHPSTGLPLSLLMTLTPNQD